MNARVVKGLQVRIFTGIEVDQTKNGLLWWHDSQSAYLIGGTAKPGPLKKVRSRIIVPVGIWYWR